MKSNEIHTAMEIYENLERNNVFFTLVSSSVHGIVVATRSSSEVAIVEIAAAEGWIAAIVAAVHLLTVCVLPGFSHFLYSLSAYAFGCTCEFDVCVCV